MMFSPIRAAASVETEIVRFFIRERTDRWEYALPFHHPLHSSMAEILPTSSWNAAEGMSVSLASKRPSICPSRKSVQYIRLHPICANGLDGRLCKE